MVEVGIVENSMRASLIAVVFVSVVLIGQPSSNSAQSIPTPAGRPLCDEPSARGTYWYNYYCNSAPTAPAGPTAEEVKAAERARADADRKRNARAVDQEGLAAESRGDLEEAANKFMKAEDFDPESAAIQAHLERVRAELADQESSEVIRVLRQRIVDSIAAAHTRAVRLELEREISIHKARVAVEGPVSAECIFDGSPGCTEPVKLVIVSADMPTVPEDAARFIKSIAQNVRERPEVKSNIHYYAHTAHIRGTLQNQMIADHHDYVNATGDQKSKLKFKLVGEIGPLKIAGADEHKAMKPLLDFGTNTIELGPAPRNGSKE